MQSAPTLGVLDEIQMDIKKKKKKRKDKSHNLWLWFQKNPSLRQIKWNISLGFFFEKVIIIQKGKYVLIYLLTLKLN